MSDDNYTPSCHWISSDARAEVEHGFTRIPGLGLGFGAVFLQWDADVLWLVSVSDEYGSVRVPWSEVAALAAERAQGAGGEA